MTRFLQIILQSSGFFTFAILQLVCFYLIINHNSEQREIWAKTVAVYGGGLSERTLGVTNYIGLREKFDSLQADIANLKNQLPNSYDIENNEVDTFVIDSLRQRFEYLPARVVNKSPYGPNNTFIIDQGREDGLKRGQGIVAGNGGVLGIVTTLNKHHARAISILHRDMRLSAGLSNNYFGTLRWDGRDPRYMVLWDVKDYVPVVEGDTVYTTGYSTIFPTRLPLGTVSETERLAGSGNWKLRVKLLSDPLQVKFVYVVQNLFKEDLAPLMTDE